MNLTPEQRDAIVKFELDKSDLNYRQALLGIDADYWDLVANRLYYSLFHAISALLIRNRIPVKSHKGAVMMFNYHFVRTEVFSKEEGQLVSFLQSKREEGDYNCMMKIEKSDIEPYLSLTNSILAKLRSLATDSVSSLEIEESV